MADDSDKIYDKNDEKPVIRTDLPGTQDGETDKKSLSPDELNSAEGASEEPRNEDGRPPGEEDNQFAAADREYDQLASRTSDQLGKGFTGKLGGRRALGKSLLKNKGVAAGLVGTLTFLTLGFVLFGIFNNFKLDHFLQNIDSRTFARFNASFAGRSDKYLKSYIRVRMMEFDGRFPGSRDGNLYFRADRVDNNGFTDWYKTLRTNGFERDLLEKEGISFTSAVRPKEGGGFELKPGKITIKDEIIGYDAQRALDADTFNRLTSGNPAELSLAINSLGDDIDEFVNVELFESDKDARREIKRTVRERTLFYQVLKRRHMRKGIQNMIGVRDWVFFEKSVRAYQEKKTNIQRKIISKALPADSQVAKFLDCIFTGNCNTRSDPADINGRSSVVDGVDTAEIDVKDADGNTITQQEGLEGERFARESQGEITEVLAEEAIDGDGQDSSRSDRRTVGQRITQRILAKFIGEEVSSTVAGAGSPTMWWRLAKKIANIHNFVQEGKFEKMAAAAKLAGYIGLYTTYATARDQIKSGDLSSAEMQETMGTIKGFDNSEGWAKLQDNTGTGTVSAASTASAASVSKETYCGGDHEPVAGEFAWFCDGQKPNNTGKVGAFTDIWQKSVGYITGPIADAVASIRRIPGVEFFGDLINSVIGKLSDLTIGAVLRATGATEAMGKIMTLAVEKMFAFAGIVPPDIEKPGIANYLITGSAGVSEGNTRLAGGVTSTPVTVGYSNRLAADYNREEKSRQSLFERYASVNNPQSLASKGLMNVSNMSLGGTFRSFSRIFTSIPAAFGNIFSGHLLAAGDGPSGTAMADWAGVQTYDIPQVCQDLDPLDADNYLQNAIGVEQSSPHAARASEVVATIRPLLSKDTARDSTAFWNTVYDQFAADDESAEDVTGAIYNCALFDRQVEGSLGYIYGYEDDGGLNSQ